MGWVEFFFDPPWWVGLKNPLNPTQLDPCTPLAQSEFEHILQDIIFLYSFFSHVSFRHIKRQGNCVVHRLDKQAVTSPLDGACSSRHN